jgi:ribosomal protein S13
VCPLKTKHHDANPTSDVAIGKIPDLLTDKETIAVFNQIRGIDKIRIYRFGIINGKKSEREGPISKLSDEQMKKIRSAIYQTIIDGNPFAQ